MQPKLRFPEFENIEHTVVSLEMVSDINPRRSELPPYFKYIDLEAVKNGYVDFETLDEYSVDNAPSRAQRVISENDILYALVRPYQQNNIFIEQLDDYDYVASTGYAQIKANNINSRYLYYVLHTKKILDEVMKRCTGTSYPAINSSDLSSIALDISLLIEEQTKIADFLSTVDKKISLLEQQQKAWQEYKQGMMQKLFSGEVRFKDENGEDFPEWVEMEIGHLLIKNSEKNRDGKIQVIDSISNKYGFVEQNEVFEDRRVASKDLSNYYVIREKCFAYNPSRIDVGSLAYQTKSRVSVISPLYISFYTNKLIDDKFLYAWLFCQKFIRQMNQSFEGSVRNTLSYDSLSKIIIDLPNLEEQKKIADYLSGLDDKINAITQQLEQMREWKKGLLQQMFV